MYRARRKKQQFIFVLPIPKWMQIKGLEKVEKILSKYTISSVNIPIANAINKRFSKPSALAQKVVVDTLDDKLMQEFANKNNEFDVDLMTNDLFDLLSTNAKRNS